MDISLHKLWEIMKDGEGWLACCSSWGHSQTQLSNGTTKNTTSVQRQNFNRCTLSYSQTPHHPTLKKPPCWGPKTQCWLPCWRPSHLYDPAQPQLPLKTSFRGGVVLLIYTMWAALWVWSYLPGPQPGLLMKAAAAAKSRQSCPTLCDPIDGSPTGSSVPGILQARTLDASECMNNACKWKVKVKLLSHVQLLATPWKAVYQAPPSMGFSRQEYWSGLPLPTLSYEGSAGLTGGENGPWPCPGLWRALLCPFSSHALSRVLGAQGERARTWIPSYRTFWVPGSTWESLGLQGNPTSPS